MEDAEIQREHHQYKKIEAEPERPVGLHSERGSAGAAARSLVVVRPHSEGLHLIVEMSLFHQGVNLRAVLSRTESRRVCHFVHESRCNGDVLLQLIEINFVVSIGAGVVVLQVIRLNLVRDQVRHTFEKEIEIVGADERVSRELDRTPLFKGSGQTSDRGSDIFSPAQRESGYTAGPFVEDQNASDLIHFVAMFADVGHRAEDSLFLSSEQGKTDRALRLETRGFDRAQRIY